MPDYQFRRTPGIHTSEQKRSDSTPRRLPQVVLSQLFPVTVFSPGGLGLAAISSH